jgi:hypothetical protein
MNYWCAFIPSKHTSFTLHQLLSYHTVAIFSVGDVSSDVPLQSGIIWDFSIRTILLAKGVSTADAAYIPLLHRLPIHPCTE